MARKKIGKKEKHQVELDPSKDEFIETSMSFIDWLAERRKVVGLILGLGLIVWIVVLVAGHINSTKEEESSLLLASGLEALYAPVVKDDKKPVSGLKKDVLRFKSKDARYKEAALRFDKAISDSSTDSGKAIARYLKAGTLVASGDFEGAVKLYKQCTDNKNLSFLKNTIRMETGTALEALGKNDEAKKEYEAVISEAGQNSRISLWARYNIARILDGQSDDKSKKLAENQLQNVVNDLVAKSDPDKNDYLLVQARARLLNINPDAKVPELPSGLDPQLLRQLLQAQQGAGGALK